MCTRSIQSKQKSVVKVPGIVESILVENECVGECADLQESVPVSGIACQSRNLQAEHDAGFFQTDFRHQLLKSFAIGRGCGRLTKIAVDNDDALHRPAQSYGALAKVIFYVQRFVMWSNGTVRRSGRVQRATPLHIT